MDNKKLLEESIVEWELKLELAKEERYNLINLGADSCPLCKVYDQCFQCPISLKVWRSNCQGTPYEGIPDLLSKIIEARIALSIDVDINEGDYVDNFKERVVDLLKAIELEIAFLKSLLEEEING